MKYIRTRDRIYDGSLFLREYTGWYFHERTKQYAFTESEIVKQANTIEELFDGFWWENEDYSEPIFVNNKRYLIDRLTAWKQSDKLLNINELSKISVYGSIYIKGKGWAHVAKMKGILPNGEVDWELL